MWNFTSFLTKLLVGSGHFLICMLKLKKRKVWTLMHKSYNTHYRWKLSSSSSSSSSINTAILWQSLHSSHSSCKHLACICVYPFSHLVSAPLSPPSLFMLSRESMHNTCPYHCVLPLTNFHCSVELRFSWWWRFKFRTSGLWHCVMLW